MRLVLLAGAAWLLTAALAIAGDKQCGGFIGLQCGSTEWCDFGPQGHCGAADRTGICQARPEICPQDYGPVCGCDGKNYANACMAHGSGVDVLHDGSCET